MNPQEQEIRELFEKLKSATAEPEKVVALCEKYLSDSTPTYELSIMGATIDPYNTISSLNNREAGMPVIKLLATNLTQLLHERGYRNNIHTHQEHILHGSSGSGLNENAVEFPYTVGAILGNEISVEEARRARKLDYLCGGAVGKFWGFDDNIHCLLLPEIDDKGIMIGEPTLVDVKKGEIVVLAKTLVESAPYKR